MGRWEALQPAWEVHLVEPPCGPWVKAAAITPAVEASSADVVVIADADVWVEGVAQAVDAVADGAHWAIPHLAVYRLTEAATDLVLAGTHFEFLQSSTDLTERPYRGVDGGGMVVLDRRTYLDCPLDPRFTGWGGEDLAWGYALQTLHGDPWRGDGPLWHLWHPPQDRASRKVGSRQSENIRRRYYRAIDNPHQMRAVVDEAREATPWLTSASSSNKPESESC